MRKSKTVAKVQFLAPDVVTKIVPAPTDGWDAISPLAEMDPKRAVILDNWVPRPGYVELRQGFYIWNDVGDDAVETLMIYRSSNAPQKMFAASGSSIWDVSIFESPTEVVTGLVSARWQYVNFTPGNGTTVIQLVNGSDPLQMYDGTSWTEPSIDGLPSGVTVNDLINIAISKRRFWYVIKDSTQAVFMPTDAIMGAIAGVLDVGALWNKGGYLVASGSWTLDGGSGPQDYTLFISSRGQVTLYAGTDPTDATQWSLVGVFDIAPPISRRCFLRVGSDLGIITQQGVLPISQALPFDPSADRSVAITARIQNAMAASAQSAGNNFGWQLISFPDQQLAILNVPLVENNTQVQYVMNALTGAWCRFTGWNANCFEIFNDDLYFGGNEGQINAAYQGGTDAGADIPVDMQCAFNWFDEPGRIKRMTMVQPLMTVGGTITPYISVDEDFNTSTAVNPIVFIQGGSLWDIAQWDVDVWSGGSTVYTKFLSVNAIGHALAVRIRANINLANVSGLGVFDVGQFDSAVFDSTPSGLPSTLQINAFNAILEMGGAI